MDGESPLEVLSRAATMVQENQSLGDDNKQSSCKQTTKWKRDRRSRLPEYSRKSDPKIQETFNEQHDSSSPPPRTNSPDNGEDSPLDMSLGQRGLPPSYAQTISNPGYRSAYRPSVIQPGATVSPPPAPPANGREELPSGISMCDPIIDEHFRRSLGSNYQALFSNNNLPKEPPVVAPIAPKLPPSLVPKICNNGTENVIQFMDSASVDDHFAKALGDTWTKLKQKEPEIKNNSSEKNLLSI